MLRDLASPSSGSVNIDSFHVFVPCRQITLGLGGPNESFPSTAGSTPESISRLIDELDVATASAVGELPVGSTASEGLPSLLNAALCWTCKGSGPLAGPGELAPAVSSDTNGAISSPSK